MSYRILTSAGMTAPQHSYPPGNNQDPSDPTDLPAHSSASAAAAAPRPPHDPTDLSTEASDAYEQALDALELELTTHRRRCHAVDWAARRLLPHVLQTQELEAAATEMRTLPPLAGYGISCTIHSRSVRSQNAGADADADADARTDTHTTHRLAGASALRGTVEALQLLSEQLWRLHNGQDTPAAAVTDAVLDAAQCLLHPDPAEAAEAAVYLSFAIGVAREAAATDEPACLHLHRLQQTLLQELATLPGSPAAAAAA